LASFDEVLNDTLLADLQWQITYGAVWAISRSVLNGTTIKKWSAKVRFLSEERKLIS
jgi:hypothetical protein